ncbi:MAG: protein kinase [Acidobacteriota bacterium]|jgi:serine/threonine-protein kinase
MKVIFAQHSSTGPVRDNNEDYLAFFQSEETNDAAEESRPGYSVAMLADGVGGHGQGEVASRMAVETALKKFHEVKPATAANEIIWQMFNSANQAVYDAGLQSGEKDRMATTLTISVFCNDEVNIGHVGDCRAYVVQQGRIRRITNDHSYVAMQLKLGLISEQEAMVSQLKSLLTRSIGHDLTIQVDYFNVKVNRGDYLIQCTDGLYSHVTEREMLDIVTSVPPDEACRQMIALAEERKTEDNLSVQVAQIERVERVLYHMGVPYYREARESAKSYELETGQILDERFQITEVINRSGMATIFKALDLNTGQNIAVKVPLMQFESDPGFFDRFEREELIGKALNHPGILHVASIENKSRPYMVMEYLEGQTLRQRLTGGRMSLAEAVGIATKIADALDYMHSFNVVHRDLKPENVMLCGDGSIRVMDFGIAKVAGLRRLTFSGFSPAMGTPDYMAPEQVKGKRGDERTDIYSLGAMLYEMSTGSAPFEGTSPYLIMNARLAGDPKAPRKLNPEISPRLEEIILHAMERDPKDRYRKAAEMKAELEAPEKVQLTGRCDRLQSASPWKARLHGVRIALWTVLVTILVFGLILVFFRRH